MILQMNRTSITLVLFAITLQIQAIIAFGGKNFNFSVADIFMFFFIITLPFLCKNPFSFFLKEFQKDSLILLFIACIIAFSIALLLGERDSWALVKYAGFYILIGYYIIGCFLFKNSANTTLFSLAFILFFNIASGVFLLENLLESLQIINAPFKSIQNMGLSGNPNIFSFLGCMALCLHCSYWKHPLLRSKLGVFLLFFELLSILTSGSRAGWVCASFVLSHNLISRTIPLKKILPSFLFLLCYVGTVNFYKDAAPSSTVAFIPLTPLNRPNILSTKDPSLKDRVTLLKHTLEWIKEKPIFGHGLGAGLKKSEEFLGYSNVIHNTLLWLLVDTGIFGVVCFLGLFFVFLRRFYRDAKENHDPFSQAVFLMLLVFAIFSLFHEILYQRALWFILGIGMSQLKKSKSTPAP